MQPPALGTGRTRLIFDVTLLSTSDLERHRDPGIKRVGYFMCQRRTIALIWEGESADIQRQAERLWTAAIPARVIGAIEEESMFIRELVRRHSSVRPGRRPGQAPSSHSGS